MATTVSNATLRVVIDEDIILSGSQRGSRTELSIADVDEYSRRIVTCATGGTVLASFGTTGAGKYPVADVKYVRITNLDSQYHITLELVTAEANPFIKVPAGHTFLLGGAQGMADDDGTLLDLSGINATANTAAVDVELVVASG